LSRGETEFQVLEGVGSATVSDGVEVTVDLAVGLQKSEVILILQQIENWILKGNWPPA
jgi:hypothetical protein